MELAGMKHRHTINPRTLLGHGLIAPHAYAFNDDPDDPGLEPDGGQEPDGGEPTPDDPPGAFSQADVDRIVQQRLAREREASERRMLETLGYESIDEAKKAAADRKKAREERMLEEKKFAELLAERDAELEQLRGQYENERSKRVTETLTRQVLTTATQAGAISPEHVAQLTRQNFRLAENGAVQVVSETGEVMTDGKGAELTVRAFLDQWLDRHPHFQRAAGGKGSNAGGGTGKPRESGFDPNKRGDLEHLRENRDAILEKMRRGELKG